MNLGLQGLARQMLMDDKLAKVDALRPIAEELGVSMAALAIAWAAKYAVFVYEHC